MNPRRDTFTPSPLHVRSTGAGDPPLVLVHGFGAHGHSWRKWVAGLEARHRLHVVDLMGFGQAAAPAGADYSPLAQAQHLVELLRGLEGPPPVLVGHSLGAASVLLAALRIQDEGSLLPLAGLILVSGAVYAQELPPYMSLARRRGIGELFLLAPPPRWLLRRGLRSIVHDPDTVDRGQVEGYRAPLRSFRRRRAILRAARQLSPQDGEQLARRLPELDLPTLLLWGKEDRVIPPTFGARLEGDLPRARLVVLEGVGHLPPEEAPQASLAPVLRFLSDEVEGG